MNRDSYLGWRITYPVHMNSENVSHVKSDLSFNETSLLVLIAAHIPVLSSISSVLDTSSFHPYKLPHPSNPHNAILFLKVIFNPHTSVTGRKARKKSMTACMLAPYIEKLL